MPSLSDRLPNVSSVASEAELGEVEKVLLYISEAREKASRVADELRRRGAPDHLIAAVRAAESALEADHRQLMQSTFFAVSDEQERLAV